MKKNMVRTHGPTDGRTDRRTLSQSRFVQTKNAPATTYYHATAHHTCSVASHNNITLITFYTAPAHTTLAAFCGNGLLIDCVRIWTVQLYCRCRIHQADQNKALYIVVQNSLLKSTKCSTRQNIENIGIGIYLSILDLSRHCRNK